MMDARSTPKSEEEEISGSSGFESESCGSGAGDSSRVCAGSNCPDCGWWSALREGKLNA